MLARGSLGNPWRFQRLLGLRDGEPSAVEVLDELRWVIDRAEEHLGPERAGRYLRKYYPWYAERLELAKRAAARARHGARPSARGIAEPDRRRSATCKPPDASRESVRDC